MPAVMTGTVVRWEVVPEGVQNKPRVRFKDAKDISVYVVDEGAEASAIAPAIIAKYILENNHARRAGRSRTSQTTTATTTTTPPVTPPAATTPSDDSSEESLLEDARKGLLQVVGIRRTTVTPPALP